ncbi:hypothetical protein [Paenibacillus puerhi]|uniref:hypothetical protein n=1 Tax=Paenibacillus puerhi TaxID=2692622 RepID=UPI00135801BE|nr:hypothetical protein [Paenibacillus puerhi]
MPSNQDAHFERRLTGQEGSDYWFDAIPDAEDGWFALEEERELEQQAEAEWRIKL